MPLAVPGHDDDVSQQHARAVLDLALRIGEAALSTGASAAEVVATVLRVTSAYGVTSTSVDITYTSIAVSMQRGLAEDPISVMRVIKVRSMDFTRLEGLQGLVDDLCGSPDRPVAQANPHTAEPIAVEEARTRLSNLLTAPHPYRRWVVTAGLSTTAIGVVILFGGGFTMWLIAGLSAALVDRAQRVLYDIGIASFFRQAASAAIPTMFAVVLQYIESFGVDIPGVGSISLVVVSGIIVLLAGLSVMGAAQDAIDGYYVTAGARGLEVFMMTLGIAVGVAIVLSLAASAGVTMIINPDIGNSTNALTSTLGAMVVAMGFCMTHYTGLRATMVAAGLAAVGWLTFAAAGALALDQAPASAVAAAIVGALAYTVHHRLRVPGVVISTAAIVALLPGLAVYRAIFMLMLDSSGLMNIALVQMATALAVGLGLAAGLSIGGYAARRRFGLDRAAVRARRRSLGAYQD